MKHTLLLLLAVFLISSCTDIDKTNRLSKIDRMIHGLDSISAQLKKEKIDTLAEMQLAAQGVEYRIRGNFVADTIDLELGKKMDGYKRMRRAIPKLRSNIVKLEKGVIELRKSLTSLKKDIENNSGARGKYDEYIKFERNKFDQIVILFKEFQKNQTKISDTYSALHVELYNFSMQLIAK
jgi:hypothetical protein